MRFLGSLLAVAIMLSACTATTTPQLGADGKPLPKLYRISKGATSKIQFRMLDSVNALRQAAGLNPVELNAQLNAAAATHARDMAVQNRPWHFGSDGSSPIDRVRRVGYTGELLGENISETYETELETLGAWMDQKARETLFSIAEPATSGLLGFKKSQVRSGGQWLSADSATTRHFLMVIGVPSLTIA